MQNKQHIKNPNVGKAKYQPTNAEKADKPKSEFIIITERLYD